jgi:hypothetical protein
MAPPNGLQQSTLSFYSGGGIGVNKPRKKPGPVARKHPTKLTAARITRITPGVPRRRVGGVNERQVIVAFETHAGMPPQESLILGTKTMIQTIIDL